MAQKQGLARKELRKQSLDLSLSEGAREAAWLKLQKMKRNGSISRWVSRCHITGRPRGVLRKFGLSRIAFREMALDGKVPGVTKASW